MAIGDKVIDENGIGHEEIACDECVGPDPDCEYCGGGGRLCRLIAPEHEIEAIFANIFSQIPKRKH